MFENNSGKEFEKLAESIYKKLKINSTYETVEHNVFLEGADGKRQIDVLIKGEIASVEINIVVECKDHKNRISIGMIDAFHSKLLDVKASKGILISKKGFSSKSISKAKRLGITLCTASEVLSGKWEPEFDMKILIEELKPLGFHFEGNGEFEEDKITKRQFLKVNGVNISNLLKEKWEQGNLSFKKISGLQELQINEIDKPYILSTEDNLHIGKMTDFKIILELRIRHFETSLKKLKGSQILKNITEGVMDMFLEIPSLEDLEDKFEPIKSRQEKTYNGLFFSIRVTPIGELTLGNYEFNPN